MTLIGETLLFSVSSSNLLGPGHGGLQGPSTWHVRCFQNSRDTRTQSGVAAGAEVPGQCQEQLTQTLTAILKTHLFSLIQKTGAPLTTPSVYSATAVEVATSSESGQRGISGSLSRRLFTIVMSFHGLSYKWGCYFLERLRISSEIKMSLAFIWSQVIEGGEALFINFHGSMISQEEIPKSN